MSTLSFWLDEPYESRPALEADERAEVCVVGAGVAGLSCALHLARRGIDTIVLERATVAAGASGRNGGFLLAGMADFHVDARERHGRAAALRVYERTLAAQSEIYALAAELGAQDAVRRTGLLRTSSSEQEADHVRRHVAALHADGFPAQLLERDELPRALRRASWNACLTDHDGALHPARWMRALARAAEQAGARVRERSPVTGPVTSETPVRTASGPVVHSDALVVAADGALPALVPRYRGRVRTRRLHMVATAALPAPLIDRPVYSRWGYEYLQQTPDGRVLAGGFSDLDGERSYTDRDDGSPAVWRRIERWLADDLGVAASATHRWVGLVGYSADGRPFVGAVPGSERLYVAGGYSGHGNVLGYEAGRQLANAIAGAGEVDPLLRADR